MIHNNCIWYIVLRKVCTSMHAMYWSNLWKFTHEHVYVYSKDAKEQKYCATQPYCCTLHFTCWLQQGASTITSSLLGVSFYHEYKISKVDMNCTTFMCRSHLAMSQTQWAPAPWQCILGIVPFSLNLIHAILKKYVLTYF